MHGERMDVSMTVGRKGLDIYTFWMLRLFVLLSWITVKAAIGEEVGPKGGHSHLQVFLSLLVSVSFDETARKA